MSGAVSDMLGVARAALEHYYDVTVDEDGALTFAHGGVVCAVQGMQLEEGLDVLNITCVVAWDLPADDDVPARVGLGAPRPHEGRRADRRSLPGRARHPRRRPLHPILR